MSVAVTFVAPPPGLGPLVDFTLDEVQGATGLYALQSAGTPEWRMFVLDAAVYVPDYSPYLSDHECEALELTRPEDAMVLVVSNTTDGKTTVNLLAPIVVNTTNARCSQVILEGQDFPIKRELTAAAA